MSHFLVLSCLVVLCTEISAHLSCDFDTDLCSWTQRSDDDFDWILHTGRTSDPTSGPDTDHTTGHGNYLLLSGKYGHGLGHTAELSSPDLFVIHPTNMTFWYHMNGVGIGNLSVLVTNRYGQTSTVWTKHGRQSSEWQSATVLLDILTLHVTFKGSVGLHYGSDIALDDIQLLYEPTVYTTPSPSTAATTTVSPQGVIDLSCNFENGMCHWVQENHTDDFDWLITNQHSTDATSGPDGDHTLGSGNYLLLDGHKIHNNNWIARIFSPYIDIRYPTDMSFWYHMNGVGIGQLIVYAEYIDGHRDVLVSMTGRQGSEWRNVKLILNPGFYKLIFEGSAKYHYGSDLGLDDIQMRRSVLTGTNAFG